MPQLSFPTKQLIVKYQAWYKSLGPKENKTTLHVDEVASAVAKFYEKIRSIMDWREEHLLRKSAIERILRRRIMTDENPSQMAESFVLELIRAGHFPNDTIPESKVKETQRAIDKYIFIIEKAPETNKDPQKLELQDWLLSILASEIEEILSSPSKERALMEYMISHMQEKIELKNGNLSEKSRKTQIAIACQKALFKLDPPSITYHTLTLWYPNWKKLEVESPDLTSIAQDIYKLKTEIEYEFSRSTATKFYSICERYDTAYLLLGDIIEKDPMTAPQRLENPEILENEVKEAYNRRLLKGALKIKRAAIYSTISIFITKVAIALAIEVPIDRYIFVNQFNPLALAINITVPPLLMAILILTIRQPSPDNLQKSILEVVKLAYETDQKDKYTIIFPKKRKAISGIIFLVYLASFIVSFGAIIWILSKLKFSLLSQFIFLMFVSLIAFAGTKLRQRAKELVIQEEKESFLMGILDLFALPVIQVGKWLSGKLAKYNIFILLFTALVEMPLQAFIEFLEQWRYFLKEKKEEIH